METEVKVPEFLKNRIDIKSATVQAFDLVMKELSSRPSDSVVSGKGKSIIVTNFGLVKGTIQGIKSNDSNENDQSDVARIFLRSLIKGTFDFRNGLFSDDIERIGEHAVKLTNNTGAIILEQVEITPFANLENKIHMSDFILFSDQIVGITLAND